MRLRSSRITITEDGEAIGTLRQFARSLDLPLAVLVDILQTDARDGVIYWAGTSPDRLLILDGGGLLTLVVSHAEGAGGRIGNVDLKDAPSGPNAPNRSALYSTRKP